MKTVGMHLVDLLKLYGVDTVFGIPGVHTVELYRGLPGSGVRHVTPRHEQGAAFMADGYARATGRPGVCFLITGPGLTNAVTAMGQAYADSVPMLVVTAVNALGEMGSGDGFLHELPDQRKVAGGVAAFSHTVTKPAELAQVLARAFAVFDGARARPVHIEIPIDVIVASAEDLPLPATVDRIVRPVPPAGRIAAAAERLAKAERPLIFAGGGALDAAAEVRALAEALDAPVILTINGRGILPAGHSLAVPFSPSMAAVHKLIADADVVAAFGTEIGPTDYDFYSTGGFSVPGFVIRVDVDPEQMMRTRTADLALLGDAGPTAAMIAAAIGTRPDRDGAARAAAANKAAEAELDATTRADMALLEVVRRTLPDALIVGDSTRMVYAGNFGFAVDRPRTWFNAATGYGALGYGLPAAIGAKIARPDKPVVCLAGDGGLQFSLTEFGAAVEAGAPVIVLMLNNFGYGEIKNFMIGRQIEPIGVDLFTPDFAGLARAYGWDAALVVGADALASALDAAAASGRPTLIELRDAS